MIQEPMSREHRLLNELERQRQTTKHFINELDKANARILVLEEALALAIKKQTPQGETEDRKRKEISKKKQRKKR